MAILKKKKKEEEPSTDALLKELIEEVRGLRGEVISVRDGAVRAAVIGGVAAKVGVRNLPEPATKALIGLAEQFAEIASE